MIVHTPMTHKYIVLENLGACSHFTGNVPHVGGEIPNVCILLAVDLDCKCISDSSSSITGVWF